MLRPRSMGKDTGTSTTAPATGESARDGRATVAWPFSVVMVRLVGTECRPSATT